AGTNPAALLCSCSEEKSELEAGPQQQGVADVVFQQFGVAGDRQQPQIVADVQAEAQDRTAALDAGGVQGEGVAARSQAGDGGAGVDREVLTPAQANLGANPAVLAEAVADVHGRHAREDVAVALIDIEVEAVAAALFGAGVLAQREIFDIGLGADVQAPEVALVRSAAGGGQGEAVPARFVLQVDALGD